jgi:two-component system, cell cycle response regulator DivK
MDIQLPIMDGYTATNQIKADPTLRSIPIIAVTSYALASEETKARAAGCDDYVTKPFSPRQFVGEDSAVPASIDFNQLLHRIMSAFGT